MPLVNEESRKHLLARARAAIARAIGAERETTVADAMPESFRAGAFVTLRVRGQLRGCIGYPEPALPLIEVVEHCAVSAAVSDPRFAPVSVSEWSSVDLEISVLGPIEVVTSIDEVEVGKHGLIIEFGSRRGLLLPQVATEWKWDAAEFASQTCVKAGLPRNAWQTGAHLYKFEAEVFGESS